MQQAISNSDPGAVDIAERLLQGLDEGSTVTVALDAARECADIYDFAGAGVHLEAARKEIDEPG